MDHADLVGVLPPNGTVCKTDYKGTNNMFIHTSVNTSSTEVAVGNSQKSLNWGLGLGFGIGIPLLLGLCLVLRILYTRRRQKAEEWVELGAGESKEKEEGKQFESGWPLIGERVY